MEILKRKVEKYSCKGGRGPEEREVAVSSKRGARIDGNRDGN